MYTKEDIEKAKQYLDNEGYGTGSNFALNAVANLMAEYAAKNCVIPVDNDTVCHCYNTECMHHRGTLCMAAQFNCEDRQTGR